MKTIKGIYCIMNVINDKKYIGSSFNIKKRWYSHKRDLNKGSHVNNHLQRAWDKYGSEKFIFYILREMDASNRTDLYKYEDEYILKFDTLNTERGYNRELSGKRLKQSINSKITLKPVLLINFDGEIVNEFISIAEAARFLECKEGLLDRILNSRTEGNTTRTNRTIKKLQIIYKEKYNPILDYSFVKKYKVEVLDENLNTIKVYNSPLDIAKEYNIPKNTVYGAINFSNKCRGMYFRKIHKNGEKDKIIKKGVGYTTKPIIVITQDGKSYTFNSTTEGLKYFNIKYEKLKYVKRCIRNGHRVYGMTWKFKE